MSEIICEIKISPALQEFINAFPGKPGTRLYYGDGAPDQSLGAKNDSYVDTTGSKIYQKESNGTWVLRWTLLATAVNELDPVFSASPAGGITLGNIVTWNNEPANRAAGDAAEAAARSAAVANEAALRTAADNAESTARIAADSAETTARIAADAAEAATRNSADAAEAAARIAGDAAEAAARVSADTALTNNLDAHIADQSNPHHTTLEQARGEDNQLGGDIDANVNIITNMKMPSVDGDATNKKYVDAEIASAMAYADSLVTSAYRPAGDWDASAGTYPIVGTGPGGQVRAGDTFRISVAGAIGSILYDVGDAIYAIDNDPGQTPAKWGDFEHNTQQATEDERGTARIAKSIFVRDETTTEDSSFVTPRKLWGDFWGRVLQLGWTWAAKQIFTLAPRFNSVNANEILEVDSNKDLISSTKKTAYNVNFGTTAGTAAQGNDSRITGAEQTTNKDASGGYVGLTLFKINFKNVLNTFTSFFTNSNTASRTYTFQDRNGTIADDTDITSAKARANHTGTQTLSTISDAGTAAAKNFGTASGNVPENGAALSNSQTVETNASGKLITVAKGTAYNKDFGTGTSNIPEIGATLGNSETVETDASGKLTSAAKGTGYNKNFGTTAGTVAQGNDSRFTDARTPTAHASSHAPAGSDALPWTTVHGYGLLSSRPAAASSNAGYIYYATDTSAFSRSNGSSWDALSITGTGGSVASDTVWDAKGDLAVGTGADTAAKLTVGSRSAELFADSSTSSGLRWINNIVNVKAYGAVGDDSTNDTAAVLAAIAAIPAGGGNLYFPPGAYRINTSALTGIPSNTLVSGAGKGASTVKATSGTHNLFEFATGSVHICFKDIKLQMHSSGGHVFAPQGTFQQGVFSSLHVTQSNPAKSIWKQLDFGYYFNIWQDSYCFHSGATSVPAFDFTSASDALHNANSFRRLTLEATSSHASYWFDFATSAAAEHLYTNFFTDITIEVSPGGVARCKSCSSFVFKNIDIYDMGTSVNSLFYVGAGSGSFTSRAICFENVTRVGGTLGVGKYDVELQSSKATGCCFISCNKSNLSGMSIQLNSNTNITAINCGSTTFNSKPSSMVVIAEGNVEVADDAYASGWNGSLQVPTKNAVYDKIESVISLIPTLPIAETDVSFSDIGTNNASTSKHGYLAKLPSTDAGSKFLSGANAFLVITQEIACLQLAADQNSTSTSFADIPGLNAVNTVAGATYAIDAYLMVNTNATTVGINCTVNHSTAITSIRMAHKYPTSATAFLWEQFTALQGGTLNTAGPGATVVEYIIKGTVTVNTAGALAIQFKSETGAQVTVKAGSIVRITRIS